MKEHKYSYKWTLEDAKFTKDKGKVFSCFACGGGSTMGYKLAGFDDKMIKRQVALIQSMTKRERAVPQILQASRKKRIAAGAGQEVSELNKLIKMHRQMADMMKKMGKMGKGGMLKQAMRGMFGKGGQPAIPDGMDIGNMDPKAMEAAARFDVFIISYPINR